MPHQESEKVETLFSKYKEASGSDRLEVMGLILTCAGTICEEAYAALNSNGLEHLQAAAIIWEQYDAYIEALLNTYPQEAFKFAIQSIEVKKDKLREDAFARWIKANGVALLSDPRLKD